MKFAMKALGLTAVAFASASGFVSASHAAQDAPPATQTATRDRTAKFAVTVVDASRALSGIVNQPLKTDGMTATGSPILLQGAKDYAQGSKFVAFALCGQVAPERGPNSLGSQRTDATDPSTQPTGLCSIKVVVSSNATLSEEDCKKICEKLNRNDGGMESEAGKAQESDQPKSRLSGAQATNTIVLMDAKLPLKTTDPSRAMSFECVGVSSVFQGDAVSVRKQLTASDLTNAGKSTSGSASTSQNKTPDDGTMSATKLQVGEPQAKEVDRALELIAGGHSYLFIFLVDDSKGSLGGDHESVGGMSGMMRPISLQDVAFKLATQPNSLPKN
jgi:hypothetical protein